MKRTREPIQVYLTEEERTRLEQLAATLGVSRSEVLRRGISALTANPRAAGPLADLVSDGLATPARIEGRDAPPPAGRPVARLADLLAELRADRDRR
jgi:predicted ArsR family transcriptional regulator